MQSNQKSWRSKYLILRHKNVIKLRALIQIRKTYFFNPPPAHTLKCQLLRFHSHYCEKSMLFDMWLNSGKLTRFSCGGVWASFGVWTSRREVFFLRFSLQGYTWWHWGRRWASEWCHQRFLIHHTAANVGCPSTLADLINFPALPTLALKNAIRTTVLKSFFNVFFPTKM